MDYNSKNQEPTLSSKILTLEAPDELKEHPAFDLRVVSPTLGMEIILKKL